MVNARCSQTFFLSDIVIALTTCAMVQVKTSGPCAKLEDGHQFSLGFVITHYAWIPPVRGMTINQIHPPCLDHYGRWSLLLVESPLHHQAPGWLLSHGQKLPRWVSESGDSPPNNLRNTMVIMVITW